MKTRKSSSVFQPGEILHPGGHLETCGDTAFKPGQGRGCHWYLVARGSSAEPPAPQNRPPPREERRVPSVSRPRRGPCSGARQEEPVLGGTLALTSLGNVPCPAASLRSSRHLHGGGRGPDRAESRVDTTAAWTVHGSRPRAPRARNPLGCRFLKPGNQ